MTDKAQNSMLQSIEMIRKDPKKTDWGIKCTN